MAPFTETELMESERSHHALQPQRGALVEVEASRAVQEVQASLIIAKRFPRDEIGARNAIVESCKRPKLAELAVYSYPRGGQRVEGPSIRLAEVIAQCWGNIAYGIRELERVNGVSKMEAYAWDQQTNARATRQFDVAHERHTRKGSYALTDSRDIYELTANQGARRLRACILAVVPGHIVDEALEQVNKTLEGGSDRPLQDRAARMVQEFTQHGVNQAMIEARLGHKLEAITNYELVDLRKVFASLRDGMSAREDWFDATAGATAQNAEDLKERLGKARGKKAEPPAQEPAEEIAQPVLEAIQERLEDLALVDDITSTMDAVETHLSRQEREKLLADLAENPPFTALLDKAMKAARKAD